MFEDTVRREHSVTNVLGEISKIETVDFELKAALHGHCDVCSGSKIDAHQYNHVKKDKTTFDFILKARAHAKNAKRARVLFKRRLSLMQLPVTDKPKSPATLERERLANRPKIVERVMAHYEAYLVEIAEASRPKYIELFEKAKRLHMDRNYAKPYEHAVLDEQQTRESIHRKVEELEDFKHEISRLWKGELEKSHSGYEKNDGEDEIARLPAAERRFLEALLTIEEEIAA